MSINNYEHNQVFCSFYRSNGLAHTQLVVISPTARAARQRITAQAKLYLHNSFYTTTPQTAQGGRIKSHYVK
jgi:hypothetical protein